MGKVVPVLIKQHIKETSGGTAPFLTLVLGRGKWSTSRPGLFISGEYPPVVHRIEHWVGPSERKVLEPPSPLIRPARSMYIILYLFIVWLAVCIFDKLDYSLMQLVVTWGA
jgi:hypothetical protein